MKTTIDKAGRVVIPSVIRKQAGLKPGTELEIVLEDFSIRLIRAVSKPELKRVGKRLVVKPTVKPQDRPAVNVAKLIEEERNRWPY